MTEKCIVCNEKIDITFLEKIKGTYIRKGKKLEAICSNCQRKLKNENSK